MSFLTSPPPKLVQIGGKDYPICTDFRVGIRFEMMTLCDQLTPEAILTMFYGEEWPLPYDEAIQKAIWFYKCGKTDKEEQKGKREVVKSRRSYDFEVDADALYSSFQSAYGIDLIEDNLHWWAFRELMLGLPEDTPFRQRVNFRIGSTEGMSAKQKKRFEECRKKYALPERGSVDRKMTLLEREAAMKKYVAERFREAYGTEERKSEKG